MPSYVHHSSQLDRTSANAKEREREKESKRMNTMFHFGDNNRRRDALMCQDFKPSRHTHTHTCKHTDNVAAEKSTFISKHSAHSSSKIYRNLSSKVSFYTCDLTVLLRLKKTTPRCCFPLPCPALPCPAACGKCPKCKQDTCKICEMAATPGCLHG